MTPSLFIADESNASQGGGLPQRVVVVRALKGLGDLLCAVPAFRSLRAALPAARIALVGLPAARPVMSRFTHYVDELIELPGYPGLPECQPDIRALPEFFSRMHHRCFDLALQLHGSGTVSNPLAMMLGAKITAGLFVPGEYCPDPLRFAPFSNDESEIRLCLRVLERAGIPAAGEELEFPLREEDYRRLADVEEMFGLRPGRYACIHAGSSNPEKRWPPDRFAAVGDWLASRSFRVVLTGVEAEREVTRQVAAGMQSPVVDMAGRTDLPLLAALFRRASLLVVNDTGASHLAAAVGLPSVVVFASSATRRWAPLNGHRHRVVIPSGQCGVAAVSLDNVLAVAADLLYSVRGEAPRYCTPWR